VYSDTDDIYSDTTAMHTQTTTIASDLVVVASDCVAIETTVGTTYSDTTAMHTQTTTIASDLVVVASDCVAIETTVGTTYSDTTAMHTQTTTIASDLVVVASDCVAIETNVGTLGSWQIRCARNAAVSLTGGTVEDVFTISGGPILLLGIFAHVDTVVDAACNAKWQHDPTVGSTTDLCAVVDSNTDAVGDIFYIEGATADAMVRAATGTASALGLIDGNGVFLMAGGIDLNLANSDPTTGEWDVYLVYLPLTASSAVA